MISALFSKILGGLGGFGGMLTGAGAGGITGAGAPGMINPFSNAPGSLTSLIGGPGSQQGTLFSLPGELATGIVDLGTSENIIRDIAGLTKPVENLASGALGSLGLGGSGNLNPFGSGGSGRLGGIIPYHYLPFLGLGAAAAAAEERQMRRQQQI